MPTNLYGPCDNYDLETSHVLPALIRKFHLAKLALNKDWEAVAADELRHGTIPGEIRACLGDSRSPEGDALPQVVLWGSGRPYREFLHVDDLAAACLFVMNQSDERLAAVLAADRGTGADVAGVTSAHNLRPETCLVNVGTGRDLTIKALAETVADVVGYAGQVIWDTTKPDGTPRKQLDVSRLRQLGWQPRIGLREGIQQTYQAYLIA